MIGIDIVRCLTAKYRK